MKKLTLILLLAIFSSFFVYAQEAEKIAYCNLIVSHQPPSNKFFVQVDYGEPYTMMKQADERAPKDEKGNKIEFNSQIHALNYMIEKGWKFVQLNILTSDKTNFVQYHYLLSKKKQ